MEGVKRADEIVFGAQDLGIEVLTMFTFSTENWNRPEGEITTLMGLVVNVLKQQMKRMIECNIRFNIIGRRENIPSYVLDAIHLVEGQTKDNTGLHLNLAFNYGSRLEILDATRAIAEKVKEGQLSLDEINEETFSEHLYTQNIPDPDLLIRTSGEKRISNFLLWQLSYAEFFFSEKYWPDFTISELKKALDDYGKRSRRFGGHISGKEQV